MAKPPNGPVPKAAPRGHGGRRPVQADALSNTTLGVFMALLDSSIVLISLLWMLVGYLVVTAVLL